jgi:phytoene dehydrogenase-like protein
MQSSPSARAENILVIGAGLGGLTCAKVLAGAGADFLLLEAADRPGGRVVSDRTAEGFVLDRGFQVLLDTYPAARRHLDLPALGGGYFRSGAQFVGRGRPRRLESPLRNPFSAPRAVFGGPIPFADTIRFALLALGSLARSDTALRRRAAQSSDESVLSLLQRRGFSAAFLRDFAQPFFGGVLLDPSLGTSAALFLAYLRRFVAGRALLPGEGIGAIPRQLAAHLPSKSLRYGCRAESLVVRDGAVKGVRLSGGEVLDAGSVVLAVDEPALCRLLGSGSPRAARPTAVHYFAVARNWYDGGWLCLPPRTGERAVLHAALASNVAPSLAPPGAHLWSVTVRADHPRADDAEFVARDVAGWFGADPRELRHLDFVRVPYAVPDQPPGFAARLAPGLPRGVFLAGDAACGASIDAAMASGEAAAQNLIASRSAK